MFSVARSYQATAALAVGGGAATDTVWLVAGQSNIMAGSAIPTGWTDDASIQVWDGTARQTYKPGAGASRGAGIIEGTGFDPGYGAIAQAAKIWRVANPTKTLTIWQFGKGSTALGLDWLMAGGGSDLFNKGTTVFTNARNEMIGAGLNPVVDMVWWMQGEADMTDAGYAAAYQTNLTNHFTNMRANWFVPAGAMIVVGRPVRVAAAYREHVRDKQAASCLADANAYLMDTDTDSNDGLHYDDAGMLTMGTRLYNVRTGVTPDLSLSIPATPTITSASTGNVNENDSVAYSVTHDVVAVSYAITGGPDAALVTISSGGAVSFVTPPNYEIPTDAGADNNYNFTVGVTNGRGNQGTKSVTITILDVAEGGPNAETTALINHMDVRGATPTVPFTTAADTFITTMKGSNLFTTTKMIHLQIYAYESDTAHALVNWVAPGTWEHASAGGGTWTAKTGYSQNNNNANTMRFDTTHTSGAAANPSTAIADRDKCGLGYYTITAETLGNMILGAQTAQNLGLRRTRAKIASGNFSYTAPDTTGMHSGLRQNSANIEVYNNAVTQIGTSPFAAVSAAIAATNWTFPGAEGGASDGQYFASFLLTGTWSQANLLTLKNALAQLRTDIAAL
jgi:hypothetical protein